MLYFAYGSNLNKRQMRDRCPDAQPVGRYMLMNSRLVFRMVADIIPEEGSFVLGALWQISERDLESLDIYEGVASGVYNREAIELPGLPGGEREIIVYTMNSDGIMPPSYRYLETIKQGYRDFGLSMGPLMKAVERSHDDRRPSHIERRRMRLAGRPFLAARPSTKVAAKVAEQKAPSSKKARKAAKRASAKAKAAHEKATQRDIWAHATPDMMRRKVTNLSDYLADRRSGGYRH